MMMKNNERNGAVISFLCEEYTRRWKRCDDNDNNKIYRILCFRTPTTGAWMETISWNPNVTLQVIYLYYFPHGITRHQMEDQQGTQGTAKNVHRIYCKTKEDYEQVWKYFEHQNVKFDLICFDTFHEWEESHRDLKNAVSTLHEEGILFSHDCFPETLWMSSLTFRPGPWCGTHYVAWIHFLFQHPSYYSTLWRTDTGIGILSKRPLRDFMDCATLLVTKTQKDYQNTFLSIFQKEWEEVKKQQTSLCSPHHPLLLPKTYFYFRQYASQLLHLWNPS